ncbi:MAG: SPASM domain-containing protein [Bacteroidales bacterium]|nr:SPASM domain-containing protein [Bacteroidales bacterium]
MNLRIFIIFVKKLSFWKLINYLKVLFSYFISIVINVVWRSGFPFSMSVEPNNTCNLKCPECPVGLGVLKRKKGSINEELYHEIIDQSAKYLLNLFLYFQGEPFLNKNIFRLIEYADRKKIFVTTSTNGHFLSTDNCLKILNSGIDKLIISLDGTTQDSYSKYRINGNIDVVLEGIRNLVSIRKEKKSLKPYIELQFLVLKTNEHQIHEVKRLAKSLKVDKLSFKSAQIYDFENDNQFIPENPKYSRYKKSNEKWILKNKIKNRCWRLWNSVVITWDGNILPCCFDKDAEYSFGNIRDSDVKSICKNDSFKMFANKLLTIRKEIDICKNCSE